MSVFNLENIVNCISPASKLYDMFDYNNAEDIANSLLGSECDSADFKVTIKKLMRNHKSYHAKNHVKFSMCSKGMEPVNSRTIKSFLYKFVDIVVPVALCGNFKNKRQINIFIGKLSTKGYQQTVFIEPLLNKIDLMAIEWMSSVSDVQRKIFIFDKVMLWLIQTYICYCLKHIFYIIKATNNYELFYFWKTQWISISSKCFEKFRRRNMCIKLDTNSQIQDVDGSPILRFRPKKGGVRPLMIKCPKPDHSIVPQKTLKILQKFLSCLFLKANSETHFHKGTNLIEKWSEKYLSWKDRKLHFVKMDVKDAFGSVNHDLMKTILEMYFQKYLTPDQYIGVKTISQRRKTRVLFDIFDDDYHSFQEPEEKYMTVFLYRDTVKSFEYIFFRWENEFYKMNSGLAQGSAISTALCNLYLLAMDEKYFSEFASEDTLFFREIDDYLFVTLCHDQATKFHNLMKRGIPLFNIAMNSKTQTSDTNKHISYLKYIINTETLEIEYNYSKYTNKNTSHWISLKCTNINQQERFIQRKIIATSVFDCELIKANFNSKKTALKIIYDSAYLQARRLHFMIEEMILRRPPEFVLQMCDVFAAHMEKKVSLCFPGQNVGRYLSLQAFYEKLKPDRKHSFIVKKYLRRYKRMKPEDYHLVHLERIHS